MLCECYLCGNEWKATTTKNILKCPKCNSFEWNRQHLNSNYCYEIKYSKKGCLILGKKTKLKTKHL
ncbi:hypothetical protein D6777_03105 [Candidatus Woesearchaeota archaeon]|nr:MAG: hypothetical protein D6777_03105 [Candidatus Woesearchaeota archaeon]